MKESFYNTNQTPRNYQYYEVGTDHDDGSVEVDMSSSRSNRTPTFKNKIEEEVYYHPNNKKK